MNNKVVQPTCTVGTCMYIRTWKYIYLKVTIIYGYKFERILKIVDLAGINFIENVR